MGRVNLGARLYYCDNNVCHAEAEWKLISAKVVPSSPLQDMSVAKFNVLAGLLDEEVACVLWIF